MATGGFFDIIRWAIGWKSSVPAVVVLEIEEVELRSPITVGVAFDSALAIDVEFPSGITKRVEARSKLV